VRGGRAGSGAERQARRLRTASGKWKVLRGGGGGERRRGVDVGRGPGCGGGCAHGVVLGVVAEALGDDGVAEEEGEVGEDVLAGGGDGARGGELGGALLVGVGHGWLCRWVWLGCLAVRRPAIRLAGKAGASTGGDLLLYHFSVGACGRRRGGRAASPGERSCSRKRCYRLCRTGAVLQSGGLF